METGTAWACLLPWGLQIYFCQLIPRVIMLVFVLVSAAIEDESRFKFKWLWHYTVAGQGHHFSTNQSKTTTRAAAALTAAGLVSIEDRRCRKSIQVRARASAR